MILSVYWKLHENQRGSFPKQEGTREEKQRCFFENLCLKVGVVGNAVQVNGEARADISEMRTSMCGNTGVR